jgi:hypothetical protein
MVINLLESRPSVAYRKESGSDDAPHYHNNRILSIEVSRHDDNIPTCNTIDVTQSLLANSESGNLEAGRSGWRLLISLGQLRQADKSL